MKVGGPDNPQFINLAPNPNDLAAVKVKQDTRGTLLDPIPAAKPAATWKSQSSGEFSGRISYGKNGEVNIATASNAKSGTRSTFISPEPYTPLKKMARTQASGQIEQLGKS